MSKLVRVEVGRFDYRFVGEFKFFRPNSDGITVRPTILVRITDEAGYQGWGQAVPVPSWTYETPETVESTIVHYLSQAVLGTDPADIDAVHAKMDKAIAPACSTGQPLAKAAIDLACYDLLGKRENKPVHALIGEGGERNLQLSWTINSTNMEIVDQQLEEGRARGYKNFNIKVGLPQTLDYDFSLAKRVREFSPSGFLWADANTGYDVEAALEVLPALADAGVEVIESPLAPLNIRGYQALKKQGALPVFMDEGIINASVLDEFISLDMLDGVTIKVARSGGIRSTLRIIEKSYQHNLEVLGSGLTDPDLSLAASLHLFAGLNCCRPYALNGPQFLGETLAASGLEQIKDSIVLPQSPGLGLVLKETAEEYISTTIEL